MRGNGNLKAQKAHGDEDEWEQELDADEDELEEMEPATRGGARPSLNINLVSGLVHWVSMAREKLGDQGMEEMVELYFKTTGESAGAKEMISHVADMLGHAQVPAADPYSEQGIAQQWSDLLVQLHGTLTWDCVPPGIPGLDLALIDDSRNPRSESR